MSTVAPNVFSGDAFTQTTLTKAIQNIPYTPSQIDKLGIFEQEGVSTTTVEIESENGTITLLPTKRRGEPATRQKSDKRQAYLFKVPHIPFNDEILPGDVQNVRETGTLNMKTLSSIMLTRLQRMARSHAATHEFHRAGALKGIVLDSDNTTVLLDLFSTFNITRPTKAWDLNNPDADLTSVALDTKDTIDAALGASPSVGTYCFAGANWFRKFISHKSIKDAYRIYQDSASMRTDQRYAGFTFQDITFVQYRGKVSGASYIADDEAQFFPLGVDGLFRRYNAPGNFMGAVNSLGEPLYARQIQRQDDSGWDILTESNPLFLCTKPGALVNATIAP